ncbi:hypothetical protein [Polaribacter porphyrae]|uniref:Uncharacterized protein n=1 Tax=Polaribacter porphyrae TaxID=1137780 RepID=A0A2S7WM33_9FLAO|nr:hypothetical protein [Polaribacter porphyrae]PQJ78668.1 hypothetical protein BTO18_05475 [Polaribacter porphyrae]
MQQDIKEQLKNYKEEHVELSTNHSTKFENLLQQELHQPKQKKYNFKWLSVAASIVLLISLAIKFYPVNTVDDTPKVNEPTKLTLGTISPEFQTIENYYVNSINIEISQLDLNDENKELVDGYLLKITELTKEYKSLTKELNTKGVNDATIDALIRNLQLRLQLLKRLKKQLKQLKNLNTQTNETQII